jgi:CRP-like cAMP-binding protein
VLHGLVKIDTNLADGRSTTFIAVAAGGWLGEGSLLKREPRPYEVTALQDVRIACMPRATFHWLYERSLAFNQFLVGQMNARLAHFIALLERARVHSTSELVAFGLASLLDAAAPPGTGDCVRISQEELGRLCGVSRQVTARGLHRLQEQGVIRAEYGVIQVRDPAGLRSAAGIGA